MRESYVFDPIYHLRTAVSIQLKLENNERPNVQDISNISNKLRRNTETSGRVSEKWIVHRERAALGMYTILLKRSLA